MRKKESTVSSKTYGKDPIRLQHIEDKMRPFLLKDMDGQDCPGGPVNGRLLKHYYF